jgi:hypothetical protein
MRMHQLRRLVERDPGRHMLIQYGAQPGSDAWVAAIGRVGDPAAQMLPEALLDQRQPALRLEVLPAVEQYAVQLVDALPQDGIDVLGLIDGRADQVVAE